MNESDALDVVLDGDDHLPRLVDVDRGEAPYTDDHGRLWRCGVVGADYRLMCGWLEDDGEPGEFINFVDVEVLAWALRAFMDPLVPIVDPLVPTDPEPST